MLNQDHHNNAKKTAHYSRTTPRSPPNELSNVLLRTGLHRNPQFSLPFDEVDFDELHFSSSEDESSSPGRVTRSRRVSVSGLYLGSDSRQLELISLVHEQLTHTPQFDNTEEHPSALLAPTTAVRPGSLVATSTEVYSLKSNTSSIAQPNSMAAVAVLIVPIVLGGLQEVVPAALQHIKGFIDQAIAKFHAAHPGQSVWQVFGAAIAHLWRDNHIDQKLYNALYLGAFVAKISNFSKKLIHIANVDPALTTPPDVVAHWDTAKLVDMLSGDDSTTDAAVVRKNMFKAEPVGAMAGMLIKDKFPMQGDLKSHVLGVFQHFNEVNELQKPEPFHTTVPISAPATIPLINPVANPVTSPVISPITSPIISPVAFPVIPPVFAPNTAPVPATGKPVTDSSATVLSGQSKLAVDASTTEDKGVNIVAPQASGLFTPAPAANPSPSEIPLPHTPPVAPPAPLVFLLPNTPPVAPLPPKASLTPHWLAAHPAAFLQVPEEDRPLVKHTVSSMLRTQAISPTTTAMQELMKLGAPSSKAIIRNPKAAWVAKHQDTMGTENSQLVFNNA